jgi:polysaccharide deacetylase 2 family uncharacterized protein YibQ
MAQGKGGAGLWLGAALIALLAWWAFKPATPKPPVQQTPPPAATPVPANPTVVPTAVPKAGAELALVLDDWGYQQAPIDALPSLPKPLTLAVIPRLAHSKGAAEAGAARGDEVILHCPMQAQGKGHPEPEMLHSGLSAAQVRTILDQDFATVPGAIGMNNHEGSKATEDRALMDSVAAVLKARGAYFLDSVTTPHSAIPAAAQAAGIPWAARRVFLDDKDDVAAVKAQLALAAKLALKNGHCIAIGHPRLKTLQALREEAAVLAAQGVTLVKVSELLQR